MKKFFETKGYEFYVDLGKLIYFSKNVVKNIFEKPSERDELLRQMYLCGYKSLPLISITAFIVGLVLSVQSYPILSTLGAEMWLPGMVLVSVVRELGPVLTALIFTGKVASGFSAELATMRVTEQIEALEVSGINVMKYLVSTRVLAAFFMVPVLVLYTDFVAFIGAYFGMYNVENISFSLYLKKAFDFMSFSDFFPAFIKTFLFGFAIGIIACYRGYYAQHGTKGVGNSVNIAVVQSSLAIFIIDLIVVQISNLIL